MAVTLVPKLKARERIEVFGPAGVGKSTCLLSIAARCPSSTFYIGDFDDAYERLQECWPDEHDGKTVENLKLSGKMFEWDETVSWLESVSPLKGGGPGTEDDWLVIDMSSTPWEWARDHYNEMVFGKTTSEYFLSKRQQLEIRREQENKSSGGGLGLYEQNTDWPAIKALYDGEIHRRLLRWPGHVFLAAEETKLGANDDKETKQTFAGLGARPRGHSRTPHLMQTIFYLKKPRTDTWQLTTAKDRGRGLFEDYQFTDFAKEYLVDVAGWKLARV